LIASPIILVLPVVITGKNLYEEVWAHANSILVKDSKFLKRENLWWDKPDWK